jgi:hypothetical protein
MSCFGKGQRQSLASWRLCLTVFTFISSTGYCKSTADSFGTSAFSLSSSSLSPRKTLDQEIGSPSELAWQAWLLVENKSGRQSALDSANILRRITPKSIFIAPELISCPNGYTSDGKGVCKPAPIKIDEDAQRQFFLKRLNALYGKFGNNRKKPVEVTGPLQINIPISLPTKNNPPGTKPAQPLPQQQPQQPQQPAVNTDLGVTENRLPISVEILPNSQEQNNNGQDTEATVVYKVDNDTNKDQNEPVRKEETSFFLGGTVSSPPKKDDTQIDEVLPVAEIVDEMNDTFSGVLDYKIPLNQRPTLNRSQIFDKAKVTLTKLQFNKNTDGFVSSDNVTPTVVLLLSPTRSPFTLPTQSESSKIAAFEQAPVDREPEQIENTSPSTEDETKSEALTTIHTVAPLITQTTADFVDSTIKNTEKTYAQDTPEDETTYTDEETQTEQESENHDNYDDSTDGIDQGDFEESEDELLKAGEAGMMISHKNRDIIRHGDRQKQYKTTVVDLEAPTSTFVVDTTPMPTYSPINVQNSFDAVDSTANTESIDYMKDDIVTTQTTEVPTTIVTSAPNVEETTTFVPKQLISEDLFKTATRRSPTQSSVIRKAESDSKMDFNEELESEREVMTEPKIIFSTQGSHSITTGYGSKRPPHPARVAGVPFKFEEFEETVPRTEETPVINIHRYNPSDQKHQKLSIMSNSEPIFFKNEGNIPSDFKDQIAESSKPLAMNLRRMPSQNSEDSFVRFPETDSERLSQRRDYVRFPSDEVNSIHNQDNYKDHLLSPYHSRDEYGSSSPTSTKSSVPTRQKPQSSHWRIPSSGARMDRQHQQSQQQTQAGSSTGNQRQQKQKPMLLRFWARMPLVRDLSFYPTTSHGSHNEPIGGPDDSRRSNSRFSSATAKPGRKINRFKEMSSHDVNRLLAQQLGQSAHGD